MTDLHCHILPGLDDGAQTLAVSLRMAQTAVSCGVSVVAATPHWNPDTPGSAGARAVIAAHCERLQAALREHGIPLTVIPGAEIFAGDKLGDAVRHRTLPTLGSTRYVLVEFDFATPAALMEQTLFEIAENGYLPIAAHPERYDAVQKDPARVAFWFRRGILIQLNKGSFPGRFGPGPAAAAGWLLAHGFAHVVASDAHSDRQRTPAMDAERDEIAERFSSTYADILFSKNPARILRGLAVCPTGPTQTSR